MLLLVIVPPLIEVNRGPATAAIVKVTCYKCRDRDAHFLSASTDIAKFSGAKIKSHSVVASFALRRFGGIVGANSTPGTPGHPFLLDAVLPGKAVRFT